MKNFFKQLGKALCYYLLFFGMQVIASFAFSFVYSFMAAFEAAAGGGNVDANAVSTRAAEMLMDNLNAISIAAGVLTLLFLWIFFLIRKKKLRREVGIAGLSVKYILYIIVLGIVASTLITFGMALLPESWLEAYAEQAGLTLGGLGIVTIISNMIMAPIVEEIIFRGLMLSRLRKAMPLWAAVVISSLLFGLAHGQILWIAYATILGLILSAVAVKTQSLTASILLHMVFNICGTVIPMLCSDITSIPVCATIAGVTAVISVALLVGLLKERSTEGAE